jgi:UDP:flavonoid glycosyltransferase YjiC (YdhE family)
LAKFLIASNPAPGHVGPLLNVARILIDAGHDVLVNTGESFRRQATAIGARFVPLMGGAAIDVPTVVTDPRRLKLQPGPELLRFDIEHISANAIPDQVRGMDAICVTFLPTPLWRIRFSWEHLPSRRDRENSGQHWCTAALRY